MAHVEQYLLHHKKEMVAAAKLWVMVRYNHDKKRVAEKKRVGQVVVLALHVQ